MCGATCGSPLRCSRFLHWFDDTSPQAQQQQHDVINRVLTAWSRGGIDLNFGKVNTIREPRTGLEAAFRAELVDYFLDDIMRLADLLKRDVSAWSES